MGGLGIWSSTSTVLGSQEATLTFAHATAHTEDSDCKPRKIQVTVLTFQNPIPEHCSSHLPLPLQRYAKKATLSPQAEPTVLYKYVLGTAHRRVNARVVCRLPIYLSTLASSSTNNPPSTQCRKRENAQHPALASPAQRRPCVHPHAPPSATRPAAPQPAMRPSHSMPSSCSSASCPMPWLTWRQT